jgi:hypothetical protein
MKKMHGIPALSAILCLLSLFSAPNCSAAIVPVVGVMGSFYWGGGSSDPIEISMQVSTVNKTTVTTLLHTSMSNTNVEFKFDIYDYDLTTHAYYKCAHSNGITLRGLVQKTGGELVMNVNPDQSTEVTSPKNFTFSIGIMPQDIEQNICLAVSAAGTYTKKWGVTVMGKGPQPAKAASSVSFGCSVNQGFNFQKDEYTTIGFVTAIKIGSVVLAGDFIGTGAEEVMPVELQSFSAKTIRGRVELNWSTATEVNNAGFDIERYAGGSWGRIGFVEGAGTTNSPNTYSFVDADAKGTVSYRLKQIDRNGQFAYSQAVEVKAPLTLEDYGLSQNFPNPFNPSTTITFAMRNEEHVSVTVYNSLGQAVATLFNSVAKPNEIYSLKFDGKDLSSGMYFYALQSASRHEVKKMSMMK